MQRPVKHYTELFIIEFEQSDDSDSSTVDSHRMATCTFDLEHTLCNEGTSGDKFNSEGKYSAISTNSAVSADPVNDGGTSGEESM